VGQASFSALFDDGGVPIVYFDVGAPMWLNERTAPKRFEITPDPKALVVLSHWDWDHFEYGRRTAAFHDLNWVAPTQAVGPNTYRFALKLWKAGKLWLLPRTASRIDAPLGKFVVCNGADRNNTGVALLAHLRTKHALLTGDAEYAHIPLNWLDWFPILSVVLVPHHGAHSSATPPLAGPSGEAVVSYGRGNRYGHPSATVLAGHQTARWSIVCTARHGRKRRGHRAF